MLSVIAAGVLIAAPSERMGKNGKTYVTCALRVAMSEGAVIANIVAFRDTVKQQIMALAAGDAISIVGEAKVTVYEKDGEARPSMSIIADQALTPYQLDKKRRASTASEPRSEETPAPVPRRTIAQRSDAMQQLAPASGVDDLADDLPF